MTGRRVTRVEAIELQRPKRAGVLVGTLRPGGPADKAVPALRRDDVIVSVAGEAGGLAGRAVEGDGGDRQDRGRPRSSRWSPSSVGRRSC
jgi:C-terminal processing protease CtpA/Prc